ncbi:hypothetical protein GYH30_003976 [Glycine max]|nr:hypothetical protein GYH30_003976 [Glycine max]
MSDSVNEDMRNVLDERGRGVLTRILARSRRCMCSTSSSTSTKSPTAATILRMKSVFHARRGIPQTRSQTSLVSALS